MPINIGDLQVDAMEGIRGTLGNLKAEVRNRRYPDDSMALHTDLYQINMVKTYWEDGIQDRRAVFEAFFRKMPFGGGYVVFAGLERIIEYIQNFRFTDSDIDYLRNELGYDKDFLDYLRSIRFTGKIRSAVEGDPVFANEPILQIDTRLAEAQLLETAILNMLNFHPLIATKAARIKQATKDLELVYASKHGGMSSMEFGTRRAHEFDAALYGARDAIVGGFDATSNVRAGKLFGVPIAGTHAHSMVQVYGDDYTAFKKYAKSHKNCTFLVDTFDMINSGIPAAIKVAREEGDKINFVGIRIDSGDLAYLTKQARRMLDEAGFPNAKIVISNDLDEYAVEDLAKKDAPVGSGGFGTKLITAYDCPSLGAVYKLVAIENDKGEMIDSIKLSESPEKTPTPGIKKVYRIVKNGAGTYEGDYITLEKEEVDTSDGILMTKMLHGTNPCILRDVTLKDIHETIFEEGELVYRQPEITEMREHCIRSLSQLRDAYKLTQSPAQYPVGLSRRCYENKIDLINRIKDSF